MISWISCPIISLNGEHLKLSGDMGIHDLSVNGGVGSLRSPQGNNSYGSFFRASSLLLLGASSRSIMEGTPLNCPVLRNLFSLVVFPNLVSTFVFEPHVLVSSPVHPGKPCLVAFEAEHGPYH